jgi:hypothetical protein
MTALPPDIERYLKQLRLGLAPLDAADRDEIVAEVRAHFAERLAQGHDRVLEQFAPPERYAAAFLAERSLISALAEGTPWVLHRSLWTGRILRIASIVAAVPLALIQLGSAALVVLGAMKPLVFDHIGLWCAPHRKFALGYLSDPDSQELLGWWGMPVFIAGGALLFAAAYQAQTALARRRLSQVRVASALP